MTHPLRLTAPLTAGSTALAVAPAAHAVAVRVSVENLAPADGTRLTPLSTLFSPGTTGVVFGPGGASLPGETGEFVLALGTGIASAFFSFASMVIPSNDAFIANADPVAHPVFDAGVFSPQRIAVFGANVYDTGTEVNDEAAGTVAGLDQSVANTSETESGVVALHAGFIPAGRVLDEIPSGDFTQFGYEVARITITQAPEPPTLAVLAGSLGMGVWLRRRRKTYSVM